jgi:hypothetical protein
MKSSSQYREFAEECHQLAQQAKDQRHRKILDEMAEVWNKLAEEADKKWIAYSDFSLMPVFDFSSANRNQTCAICERLARVCSSVARRASSKHSFAKRR